MSIIIKDLSGKVEPTDTFTYKDLDLGFLSGKRGEFDITDLDSIRAAITIIFSTKKGTRILDPNFGSELDQFLFAPITELNGSLLEQEIRETLKQEPRVVIRDVVIYVDKPNGTYNVAIMFTVPTLSNKVLDIQFQLNKEDGITISAKRVHSNN